MSMRPHTQPMDVATDAGKVATDGATAYHPHGEGRNFSNASINTPLTRRVVASIRATLADLCNSRARANWSPTTAQLEAIFKNSQFVNLKGETMRTGDLRNTVLHSVTAKQIKSSFPISLGCNITGVDPLTYSHIGAAYSTIVLPNADNNNERVLQNDDPQIAYDFMARYPGYTAHNIDTNGVISGTQHGFYLVSQEHPIMQAIRDNKSQLQSDETAELAENLVKIEAQLYDALLPVVRQQVENQVRVRDFTHFTVEVAPAEHTSWQSAMESLTQEKLRPLKAERAQALANMGPDDTEANINAHFDARELKETHEVQQSPVCFHIEAEVTYNFMA